MECEPATQTAGVTATYVLLKPSVTQLHCITFFSFNFLLRDAHRRLTSLIVPSWTFCIAPLRVREKCLMCRHNQFCIIYQLRVENIPQAATSSTCLRHHHGPSLITHGCHYIYPSHRYLTLPSQLMSHEVGGKSHVSILQIMGEFARGPGKGGCYVLQK